MKVECTQSVIMEEETTEAFSEGKLYKIYSSSYRDGYMKFPCIRAVNNDNEPHIVISDKLKANMFFEKHFRLIV